MGGWDCYCALCCAPLTADSVDLGSTDAKILEERRRRVARKKEKLAERRHLNDGSSDLDVSDSEEDDSNFSWEEQCKYDPEKLDLQEVAWMGVCRALCFDPSTGGFNNAYITGRGHAADAGLFEIDKPGNDPNDPHPEEIFMYTTWHRDEILGFPFHEVCYDILAIHLGYKDRQEIDKDVLYSAMSQNVLDHNSALNIDYGAIEGKEQYWSCESGYEYVVSDPGPKPDLPAMLQSLMPAKLFVESSEPLDLACKVRNDPLSVLSYDILYSILEYLPVRSMLKLARASWHVFTLTRQEAFWRSLTHMRILPWFWEVSDLLNNTTLGDSFNFKNAFLWLNESTKARFGMEGPLMGIANRRRIWQACGQLAVDYKRILGTGKDYDSNNEEAHAILRLSLCLHMPAVVDPQPQGAHTLVTQFVDSWSDLEGRSCQLDTYWSPSQTLNGISLCFGDQKRVLGTVEGEMGQQVNMTPGEWIREIRLGTQTVDMPPSARQVSRQDQQSAVTHVTVILTSGRHVAVQPYKWDNTRALLVLPGMHLIGLTGQVARNGVISRLGLLQAPRQGQEPSVQASYTAIQQALYSNVTSHNSDLMTDTMPWARSDIKVDEFEQSTRETSGQPDMMPYDFFQWAMNPDEYKRLTSITCFQPTGGSIDNNRGGVLEVPDVVGFLAEYTLEQSSPRIAGTGGPVPSQSERWSKGIVSSRAELNLNEQFQPFDTRSSVRFDIDGPGGEVVTEVHVATDMKAIKLRTNHQRECFFGEDRRSDWEIKRVGPGEMIVGLRVCFGTVGGWNWRARTYSHWKMSELGVLLSTQDG